MIESLIGSLPFGEVIAGMIVLVLGIAAAIFALDNYKDKKKKTANETDDRLIVLLQTTVNELEKKVNKQTNDIIQLSKKLDSLEKENETLVKVLQGRDTQTQEFYKQAFHAMKISEETNELMKKLISLIPLK